MFAFLTSPASAVKKGDDVMPRWWQRLEIGPGFEPTILLQPVYNFGLKTQ